MSWEILAVSKNRYRLVNHGTETATGAAIDPTPIPGLHRQLPRNATIIGGGGYVEFLLFRTAQTQLPTSLTVSWDGAQHPAEVPLRSM